MSAIDKFFGNKAGPEWTFTVDATNQFIRLAQFSALIEVELPAVWSFWSDVAFYANQVGDGVSLVAGDFAAPPMKYHKANILYGVLLNSTEDGTLIWTRVSGNGTIYISADSDIGDRALVLASTPTTGTV